MLRHDVDRFPDFIVRKGASGTVTEVPDDCTIIALMDQHVIGDEPWENHVYWESGFSRDTSP